MQKPLGPHYMLHEHMGATWKSAQKQLVIPGHPQAQFYNNLRRSYYLAACPQKRLFHKSLPVSSYYPH